MSNHEGIWTEYRPTYADHWSACKRMGDLVRCRDCKYYSPYKNDDDTFFCANFAINNVAPDDFCSHGEKRVD